MSLRLKLLLLGLATLVLPWDGIRYAREMEAALRQSEQHELQAVSETMAASLEGRMDLLYRNPGEPAPADTGTRRSHTARPDGAALHRWLSRRLAS